jgi:hypothetical protein
MKKSELKRRSPMPRRSAPLRVRNQRVKRAVWWLKDLFGYQDAVRRAEKIAERERVFGAKAKWIRRQRCAVPEHGHSPDGWFVCTRNVEAAHVVSRAAGGDSRALIPLCTDHHTEQHTRGISTFEATYVLDLEALAAEYESLWRSLEAGTQEEEK